MKIRNGFVSNSSSSSFVVAWPKQPKTVNDVVDALFGNQKSYANPYDFDNSTPSWNVQVVAGRVLQGMSFDKKAIRKQFIDDIANDIGWEFREIADFRAKGSSSTRFTDNGFIESHVLAERNLDRVLAQLKSHYPSVNWNEKFEKIIRAKTAFKIKEDKLEKERRDLISRLEKEHNIVHPPYLDTSKMSREAIAKHNAEREKFNDLQSKHVWKNPEYLAFSKKSSDFYFKDGRRSSGLRGVATKIADIFFKENEGCVFGTIEISDDSELGSAMEHGTLFDRLAFKKFSHH